MSLPKGSHAADGGRFLQVHTPWGIPDHPDGKSWGTIAVLDVIEHHPDPRRFLSSAPSDVVLVKVPNASGPLGATARAMAKMGWSSILERLLLVGDAAPHLTFFTRAGLSRALDGFSTVSTLSIPDVGSEFPERMLGKKANPFVRGPLALGGIWLELVAARWSDTLVSVARRIQPRSK
jgi:hypothetical protein